MRSGVRPVATGNRSVCSSRREVSFTFPWHAASVGRARARVRETLRAWGIGSGVVEDVELLATEIATNALRHAHASHLLVDLREGAGVVRCTVWDEGSGSPVLRCEGPPPDHSEAGRGLWLVGAVASAWGVSRDQVDGGDARPRTAVWFEVPHPGPRLNR